METTKQQFVRYLETGQWSSAASISIPAMKAGSIGEINWYFDQLMKTCNRWRVCRMVKTWLDHDVPVVAKGSTFDQFHREYNKTVWSIIKENCQTEQQRKNRAQFNDLYFKAYPVEDPLVHWVRQGRNLVDNLDD